MTRIPRVTRIAVVLFTWALDASPAFAAGVEATFDLSHPANGPFPSNRFTVADDPTDPNNTGLRVNLPKPDCIARPADCTDIGLLNKLDGFNLLPRISIPFTGAIDVSTVNSRSVFLVRLGTALRTPGDDDEEEEQPDQDAAGQVVGINQIVWDPASRTLHVHPDEFLEQYTRYLLVVTRAMRDGSGDPIGVSDQFDRFRRDDSFGQTHDPILKAYRKSLLRALSFAEHELNVPRRTVAAASVFTTHTVTSVMERIRDRIKSSVPAAADFLVGVDSAGNPTRAVFSAAAVTSLTFKQHIGFDIPPTPTTSCSTGAPRFRVGGLADRRPNLALLQIFMGSVGQIAFGKFSSPNYLGLDAMIPEVGTLGGVPPLLGSNEVHFTLFIPSGKRPATGWPVTIYGHLLDNNKNGTPFHVASTLAAHGIAVISINFVGHGFGRCGTLTAELSGDGTVTIPAGGRGQDASTIGSQQGFNVAPLTLLLARDSRRQSAIDLMQLVRVIEVGMDVDGDGVADLDPAQVYYLGVSLGSSIGIMAVALDSGVRASALNVLNGLEFEELRLAPVFRPQSGVFLATRSPSLFNGTACNLVTGTGCAGFQENIPFRNQPPVINNAPGAMEIQELLDRGEWISMQGAPIAFAAHLRKQPLDGVATRPVIVQFAKGDQAVPNPSTSALLRVGELADRATYFRTDLAFAAPPCSNGAGAPCIEKDPHRFLIRTDSPQNSPNFALAIDAQQEVGAFFASQGAVVTDPDGPAGPVFEVPIQEPLPEELNYIP